MSKIIRAAILCFASLFVTVAAPLAAADKPQNPPPAPIPAQILTAQKIFIANGGSTIDTFGIPNLTYDEFYAGIKTWGKYELAPTPANADLVYEVSFDAPVGAVDVPQLFSARTNSILQFRLQILDPKTHIVLWRVTEHVEIAALQSTWRKNYDKAMAALVGDVRALVAPPAAAAPAN
jgi:hypothetical protein